MNIATGLLGKPAVPETLQGTELLVRAAFELAGCDSYLAAFDEDYTERLEA